MLDLLCEVTWKPKMKTQINAKSNRNILLPFLYSLNVWTDLKENVLNTKLFVYASAKREKGKTRNTKQLMLMIICQELIPQGSLSSQKETLSISEWHLNWQYFFKTNGSTISKWNHASINDDDSMRQTHWCLFLRAAFEWLHANDSWAYF